LPDIRDYIGSVVAPMLKESGHDVFLDDAPDFDTLRLDLSRRHN